MAASDLASLIARLEAAEGPDSCYPIAIIEDRYSGTYSGGAWLAVAGADLFMADTQMPRVAWCLMHGPHGGDTDAMMFWADQPSWIAAANTPDAALAALKARAQG